MRERRPAQSPIPRWLRFVLTSDRAGSAGAEIPEDYWRTLVNY